MRTLIQPLIPTNDKMKKPVGSGSGAVMYENGSQTRIARAPVRAVATIRFADKEVYAKELQPVHFWVLTLFNWSCLFALPYAIHTAYL